MNNPTGLNINDLKQLSQLMSNDQSIQQTKQTQPTLQKVIKKVKIQSPPVSDGSDCAPQISQPEQPQTLDISPNFELMGYVINKQTIYLLIILILIGVGIWFMTSEKSPKKGKNKEEKKEEKHDEIKDDDE